MNTFTDNSNLFFSQILHSECHKELHRHLSREKMTEIVKTMRLDYINAKCY